MTLLRCLFRGGTTAIVVPVCEEIAEEDFKAAGQVKWN